MFSDTIKLSNTVLFFIDYNKNNNTFIETKNYYKIIVKDKYFNNNNNHILSYNVTSLLPENMTITNATLYYKTITNDEFNKLYREYILLYFQNINLNLTTNNNKYRYLLKENNIKYYLLNYFLNSNYKFDFNKQTSKEIYKKLYKDNKNEKSVFFNLSFFDKIQKITKVNINNNKNKNELKKYDINYKNFIQTILKNILFEFQFYLLTYSDTLPYIYNNKYENYIYSFIKFNKDKDNNYEFKISSDKYIGIDFYTKTITTGITIKINNNKKTIHIHPETYNIDNKYRTRNQKIDNNILNNILLFFNTQDSKVLGDSFLEKIMLFSNNPINNGYYISNDLKLMFKTHKSVKIK
jgi:hypothetical protein